MKTAEDIIYLAGVPEDFKDKYVKMINELVESKCKEAVDKYKADLETADDLTFPKGTYPVNQKFNP